MAHFTITSGILGLGADLDIYFDDGVSLPTAPNKRVTNFGDGYKLSIPLGPAKREFSGSFTARSVSESNLIYDYFAYLGGDPVNGLTILGQDIDARVLTFQKVYVRDSLYGVTASFKEIFG